MEPAQQVEVQLGHLCNNRCVFCVSGQLSAEYRAKQVGAAAVIAELRAARERGATRATLLGGEPTIQQSFFEVAAAAQAMGFDEIVIFTNGVMTPRPGFIERVCALGEFTWRFSIQGATRAHHDAVTKRPGSFDKILEGMAKLRARGQRITANMCITWENVESLPHYPALVAEHGIEQLHLDQIRPGDAGERERDYLASIMPPYAAMVEPLGRMLEGFEARFPAGFDVNVGNFPFCLLPAWAHRIHHDGQPTWTIAATETELTGAFDKYAVKRADKTHPAGCDGCVFRSRCNGLFETYQAIHGVNEVQAVSRERLRGIDGGKYQLPALVPNGLERLANAAPPPPWALERIHVDSHRGHVVLALRGNGHPLELALVPPGAAGALARADIFDLVEVRGTARDPLRTSEAIFWVIDQLFRGDEATPVAVPPMSRLVARAQRRRSRASQQSRGRNSI